MSRPAWADKAAARMCAATSPPSPTALPWVYTPHHLVAGANAADEPTALEVLSSDGEPENSVLINSRDVDEHAVRVRCTA